MSKKVFIRTFGCQMNEYDSTKIVEVMREEGYDETATADGADLIVFNTCSVREKAQEKVFSDLGRVREMKKRNPDLLIGVGGCVAAQEGDDIIRRAPYVDVVFGPQTLHRLPDLIRRRRAASPPMSRSWKAAANTVHFASSPTPRGEENLATATRSAGRSCAGWRRQGVRGSDPLWGRMSTAIGFRTKATPSTSPPFSTASAALTALSGCALRPRIRGISATD